MSEQVTSTTATVTVHLAGAVDLETAAAVRDQLLAAVADPIITAVVVDVSAVTFFDSTGLGALIYLREHLGTRPVQITIANPHPRVWRVFTLTGLDRIFPLQPQSSS